MTDLPVDALLPAIVAALTTGTRLVLRAPPGAGKTTRVPAALLDAGVAGNRKVLVLEPRRIAARAAAAFVARARGTDLGAEVGYHVRFEQHGGPSTRLWFVTEGILGRQLVGDPFLEDVGVVVLDEFHERHLPGDVALAVVRELQDTVRPDLKLAVMSATLDTASLAAYLGDCPVVTSEGRAYPVDVEYTDPADDRPLAGRVAAALRRVLAHDDRGDLLVFLPGAAEIRRTVTAVAPLAAAHDLAIMPLHGDLPLDAQDAVLRRGLRRKVVLATNVAETALTIDGVTTVIDSGLARLAWFDPRHGVNALRIMPISRGAADQRAGRAGRTAPGRCLRLWPATHHAHRRPRETPEILRLDLSALVLELRAWGLRDPTALRWLDPPPAAALQAADRLLGLLGALDADGRLSAIGQRMLTLSVAPRLARLLVEAERCGCPTTGALLAALASERDIVLARRAFAGPAMPPPPAGTSDLLWRAELFAQAARARFDRHVCETLGLDHRTIRAVARTRDQLIRHMPPPKRGAASVNEETLLRCILAAFPDRVARRRSAGSSRAVMVGGAGVRLAEDSVVRDAELFVAVELEAGPKREFAEALVHVASAVQRDWLAGLFPEHLCTATDLTFDAERERVVEREQERFHDLVLTERLRLDVDPSRAGEILADVVRRDPPRALGLSPAQEEMLERLRFLRRWMPELEWPGPEALLAEAAADLAVGRRSFAELRQADLGAALRARLSSRQRTALEREAPEHLILPSGRTVAIAYSADKPPAVAARIQELFGLTATPRLANGRVPLVVQLLAPNTRPVQITDDLESFWRTAYPEVRKQLRGRYPKHDWPEDPFSAAPTSRPRQRRTGTARR